MRGWAAESWRIESQQANPAMHDGLAWDYALAERNARELEIARSEMAERYIAAGDLAALEEGDRERRAIVDAVYADAERCERPA